jgi:hypothetical protein
MNDVIHHTGSLATIDPFQLEGRNVPSGSTRVFVERHVEAPLAPVVAFDDMVKVDRGFTQNAGNTSKAALDLHDLAYWGIVPKRYL